MTIPRYWREFQHRYRLIGTKCPKCGRIYFPPREVCPYCHRESIGKMQKVEIKNTGKVYSYTVIHQDVPDFKFLKPYLFIIAEMDSGVKVSGQLVDVSPEDVRIGMPVRISFRRIREEDRAGIIEYGYKFIPDE